MATLSQIAQGLVLYADRELLPQTEGVNKILAGAAIAAAYAKAEPMLASYLQKNKTLNEAVTMLFADKDGMIDVDTAIDALKESVRKNGKNGGVEIVLPLVGKTEFDESDFEKLREYIRNFDA